MKTKLGRIGVIGAGVMGQAIIQALIENKLVEAQNLWAVSNTKATASEVSRKFKIKAISDSFESQIPKSDLLILCVKPAQTRAVLRKISKAKLRDKTLIISIVTGVTTAVIEEILGKVPVIRAITNTPCLVGKAMTALCSGKHAKAKHLELAKAVFGAVGEQVELDESLCNAMTGLSASGPAYIYLIMEALADGGVKVGLPRDQALRIVAQTVLGAAAMVKSTGRHPASLRDDVTTPAGCTIAALLTMEDGKIRSILARAVEEATRMAKELGGEGPN